jgi:hypothetical protein
MLTTYTEIAFADGEGSCLSQTLFEHLPTLELQRDAAALLNSRWSEPRAFGTRSKA